MLSISCEKHTLSNGLDVVLHQDRSLPVVGVNVWYHVGSKNEEMGKTGFAHLFEHLMFEGSKHHKRSHFEPLQKVGASLNGSTTADRTNYWENVPSNYLELALWLEADRMGFLLDALDQERFDVQRDVVKNERRQTYENRPYGLAYALLQPSVFPSPHPYNWLTIGSQEHLDAATLDDAKAFFKRFYAPSNASLALAGDFDPAHALALVEKYFADIPPSQSINRVGRMDSDLRGRVQLTMRDRVQLSRLYLTWPTCPLFAPEQAAVDILACLLGDGRSSRLHRALVYERQIARDVHVWHHPREIAGELRLEVTVNAGHTLEEAEEAVEEELARMRNEPPSPREMEGVRNRLDAHSVQQLEHVGGFGGRADQLNFFNVFAGDPRVINTDLDRYLSVRAEDVQRVAAQTLGAACVRLVVMPEQPLTAAAPCVDRTAVPPPAPRPAFAPPVPHRTRLPNGLNVLVVERRALPVVAFGLAVEGGAVADPAGLPGVSHLCASMLPEGTTTRSSQSIAEEIETLGAHVAAEPSREHVLVWGKTLARSWRQAFALLVDLVRNPTFPTEELERVRAERLTDLRRVTDDPMAIASRASRRLLYGPASPYGHPLTGTIASVEAIGREDLLSHFRERFGPRNATLIVVGDVAAEDVLAYARATLGDWEQGPTPGEPRAASARANAHATTTLHLADKPGAAQTVIYAARTVMPRNHPDYQAMTLLNDVFGGQFSARLNTNLRQDKGYSYGYTSSIEWLRGPSALIAGGSVQTAVTAPALLETLKEFREIRQARPVSQEEFDAARDAVVRGFPSHFETAAQLLVQAAGTVLFGLPDTYFSDYLERVGAVTLDDVRRVAMERLDPDHLTILLVGDKGAVEPALRKLGLPLVHVDHEGRPLE